MRWNPDGTILARDRATGTQRVYVSQAILDDPAHDLERVPEDEYDEPETAQAEAGEWIDDSDNETPIWTEMLGGGGPRFPEPDPDNQSGVAADPTGA